jgi:hypothetical protein
MSKSLGKLIEWGMVTLAVSTFKVTTNKAAK